MNYWTNKVNQTNTFLGHELTNLNQKSYQLMLVLAARLFIFRKAQISLITTKEKVLFRSWAHTHTFFFMYFTLTLTRDWEGSLEVKQFTNFWKGSSANPSPAPFLAVFVFRIEIKCHLANGKRPKSSTDLFTALRLINGLTTSVVIYHVFRGLDEKFSTCTLHEQYNSLYSGAECRFFRVSAIL